VKRRSGWRMTDRIGESPRRLSANFPNKKHLNQLKPKAKRGFRVQVKVWTCSLQPLGLPAANPVYPLTCSIPAQGLSFLISKTTNTKTLKPKTLKPKTQNPKLKP
jgi:hypothetical protein